LGWITAYRVIEIIVTDLHGFVCGACRVSSCSGSDAGHHPQEDANERIVPELMEFLGR
jgi:hypothetical protein